MQIVGFPMRWLIYVSISLQLNVVKASIEELRKIAFDFSDFGDQNTPASRKSHVSKDFKKLGFTVRLEEI